jgi:hypothetical protein
MQPHSVDSAARPQFGYMTVVEDPEYGYFGGYLIVCHAGRPLEFHCTAPVRPSRAQVILYGGTLRPYLLGEQIGGTLFRKAKLTPQLLIADCPELICFATGHEVLLTVMSPSANADPPRDESTVFSLNGYRFEVTRGGRAECELVERLLGILAVSIDPSEPFERIRLAISEAGRISQQRRDPESEFHAAAA